MSEIVREAPLTEALLKEPIREALSKRTRSVVEAGEASGLSSATLTCLFERDGDTFVWLMKRPDTMRRHSGQVSFPGGKRDLTDTTLLVTALREAHEELGILDHHVDVLGALDDVVTFTGFVITPYVAWMPGPFDPVPNPAEVARVLTAPIRTFASRARGVFPKVGWDVEGELVWGATAAVLRNLITVIAELPR